MTVISVDTASRTNNIALEKFTKVGNAEQVGTGFSNIIDGISISNLSSQNASNKLALKDNTGADNVKKTINTAVKDKLDVSDSKDKETEQVREQDNVWNMSPETDIDEDVNSKELLDGVIEEIKNILLNVLEISEEDLEAAMQMLGLEYLDCLDKTNLTQLLTEISGSSDISVLITDETLYQQFNEILTLVDGVKEDILASLGITEDDLMTTLEQISLSKQADNISLQTEDGFTQEQEIKVQELSEREPSNIVEVAKETVSINVSSKEQETPVEQEKEVANTVDEMSGEATDKAKNITTNTHDDAQQQLPNKGDLQTKSSDIIKQSAINEDSKQDYLMMQQKQDNLINNNIQEITPINQKGSIDVESIIKQIQNQIKVTANMDTTSMGFQLNPEHLGKLTIQIASKEGIITAQITTQNLAVKEVLESQIIQLRESMTNQGLKVEAVEVTVESHEFERNLEEGNSNKNQESFEQQNKNHRRQLNYNDLDSLEDLSIEEALVAQMMIGNGNSVNYIA